MKTRRRKRKRSRKADPRSFTDLQLEKAQLELWESWATWMLDGRDDRDWLRVTVTAWADTAEELDRTARAEGTLECFEDYMAKLYAQYRLANLEGFDYPGEEDPAWILFAKHPINEDE